MADVFISYSRSDKPHAARIAGSLEGNGVSVWWDSALQPGEVYDAEIERQIDAAKCVIVIWSSNSIGSRWVRSEASVGDDRNVLIPVKIDNCRLPIAFRLHQTEDLSRWEGDRAAEPWQRILLQISALTGREPPEPVPSPGATASQTSAGPRLRAFGDSHERSTVVRSSMAPVAAAAVLLVVWLLWGTQNAGVLAIAVGLAVLAFLLFRLAENDLSPHMRALATRWLLPKEGEFKVSTAEAFNHLFEAVFGRRHFTAECFAKSTIISTAFLACIIGLSVLVFGSTVTHTASSTIGLILFGFTINAVGDYLALLKTRLLLQHYRSGRNILGILAIDVVGVLVIFFFMAALAMLIIYGVSYYTGARSFAGTSGLIAAVADDLGSVAQQPLIDFLSYNPTSRFPQGDRILLYSSFATMFMTSLWLWVALIFSPVIRLIVWSRFTGLTFVGYVFDVHHAPFAAMGYLSALLILFTGVMAWGGNEVIAAVR